MDALKIAKLLRTKITNVFCLIVIIFQEQGNGVNEFKLIHCINNILVSVGRPCHFKK